MFQLEHWWGAGGLQINPMALRIRGQPSVPVGTLGKIFRQDVPVGTFAQVFRLEQQADLGYRYALNVPVGTLRA
jgi:hypothetical protein